MKNILGMPYLAVYGVAEPPVKSGQKLLKRQIVDGLYSCVRCILPTENDTQASYAVTEQAVNEIDATEEELFFAARNNSRAAGVSLVDMLEITGLSHPAGRMFVVKYETPIYGAGVIGDPDALRGVWEKLGDFIIIPSSVHEIIAIKGDVDPGWLSGTIRDVNNSCLDAREWLFDRALKYNGQLEMARI